MMREWSCDSPRLWPSSNCSMASTSAPPRRDNQYVAPLPIPTRPRTMYSYSLRAGIGSALDRQFEALADIAPDIEAPAFHRRIVSRGEGARVHAPLHALADSPVLPIDQIPELNGVARIETRARHLMRMEQEIAHDDRAPRTLWPKRERGDVIRR